MLILTSSIIIIVILGYFLLLKLNLNEKSEANNKSIINYDSINMTIQDEQKLTVGKRGNLFIKIYSFFMSILIAIPVFGLTMTFIYDFFELILYQKTIMIEDPKFLLFIPFLIHFGFISFDCFKYVLFSQSINANLKGLITNKNELLYSDLLYFKINSGSWPTLTIYYSENKQIKKLIGTIGIYSRKERINEVRTFLINQGIVDKSFRPFKTIINLFYRNNKT